jgi:quinoprotein dehydrogenase-associated probable ABC transporter substrate-binding protein
MCSRFLERSSIGLCLLLVAGCGTATPPATPEPGRFRVCADPNNLPFSNRQGQGFENRIAELVASELEKRVEYTWFPQRRGFVRNTIGAGVCDVVLGVPANYELLLTTRPYYASTYVFVTRPGSGIRIATFDDALLPRVNVGVHVAGDDYANPPPVHALSRRKIVNNVTGYTLYGDYSQPNPPARLIEAVATGKVDVAIAWGPFGGYFAKQYQPALQVTAVSPEIDPPALPFVFHIAMGVRKGNHALRDQLNRVLEQRKGEITKILKEYGVPLKSPPPEG